MTDDMTWTSDTRTAIAPCPVITAAMAPGPKSLRYTAAGGVCAGGPSSANRSS